MAMVVVLVVGVVLILVSVVSELVFRFVMESHRTWRNRDNQHGDDYLESWTECNDSSH